MTTPFDESAEINQIHEWYHAGKIVGTLERCDLALSQPDISPLFRAQVLRRKGDCRHKLGDLTQALALYEEALSLLDKKDEAYIWILESKALTLGDLGKLDEALDILREAIGLATDPLDLDHLQDDANDILDTYQDQRAGQLADKRRTEIYDQIKHRQFNVEQEEDRDALDELLRMFPRLKS